VLRDAEKQRQQKSTRIKTGQTGWFGFAVLMLTVILVAQRGLSYLI